MAFPNKEKLKGIIKSVKEFAIDEIDKCDLEMSESKLFKSKVIRAFSELEKVINE
jgi:hypothetical protein